jgi:hypothetical protein
LLIKELKNIYIIYILDGPIITLLIYICLKDSASLGITNEIRKKNAKPVEQYSAAGC